MRHSSSIPKNSTVDRYLAFLTLPASQVLCAQMPACKRPGEAQCNLLLHMQQKVAGFLLKFFVLSLED